MARRRRGSIPGTGTALAWLGSTTPKGTTAADKAADLAISYVVQASSVASGLDLLQKAPGEGDRIVDLFVTSATPGGAGSTSGHAVVTVLVERRRQ